MAKKAGDQDQEGAHPRLLNDLEAELGQESPSVVSTVLYSIQWTSHIHQSRRKGVLCLCRPAVWEWDLEIETSFWQRKQSLIIVAHIN